MAYNSQSAGVSASTPISTSFGMLVLVALGLLAMLRIAFGSVRAEIGVR